MYVIGDYVQGIDFDLIYLDLIGRVDEDKLKEVTEKKTEKLCRACSFCARGAGAPETGSIDSAIHEDDVKKI